MRRLKKYPKVTSEGFSWALFIYSSCLAPEMLPIMQVWRTRKQLFVCLFDCDFIDLCFLHQADGPKYNWTGSGSALAAPACWVGIDICLPV